MGLNLADGTTAANYRNALRRMVNPWNVFMPVQDCSTVSLFYKSNEILCILQFFSLIECVSQDSFVERTGIPVRHIDGHRMMVHCCDDHIIFLFSTFSIKF